ncbi:hypothetical protein AAE478_002103 [Parahypoxylon ruwenzoriense]
MALALGLNVFHPLRNTTRVTSTMPTTITRCVCPGASSPSGFLNSSSSTAALSIVPALISTTENTTWPPVSSPFSHVGADRITQSVPAPPDDAVTTVWPSPDAPADADKPDTKTSAEVSIVTIIPIPTEPEYETFTTSAGKSSGTLLASFLTTGETSSSTAASAYPTGPEEQSIGPTATKVTSTSISRTYTIHITPVNKATIEGRAVSRSYRGRP